ncbi:hypothetical protein PMI29_05623 [Pseudomonas sp. GM49]|nr:hypothetical protein [Pseudomonas sp. GM49]EJM54528.1 hypothetical protein PMI29_05623 [Pseudomonas sp. GM49]
MSPGAPSSHSPLVLALIFSSPLLADDLFLDSEPLPQVLTATRLKVTQGRRGIDDFYASLELAGVLQQRLDNQPTTLIDNNYDQRHVMYFSAELEL